MSAWDIAKPLVGEAIDQDAHLPPRGSDAFLPCRAAVVPPDPGLHRRIIRRHRRQIGSCWRKLNPGRQALLAARSPRLGQALAKAKDAGHAYLVIDGTLIPIDRVAADRPFYFGKHRKHGMNLQVIAIPDGDIVWVSGPLPGAVHDLTAARIWGIIRELAASGLITLGDKGYVGEEDIRTPYRGRNKPALRKDANRAHDRLRAPGECANAQLKSWRIFA